MKFIDIENKKVNKWNRNYFWIVSVIYIILNITLYAIFKNNNILWQFEESKWKVFNGFKDLFISIGNLYTHTSWGHVLRNMFAFSFSAFYIERKIGSLNFLGLILLMSIISSPLVSMYVGLRWAGSSVIYFGVWGYVIVDYLFSLTSDNRSKTNLIIGGIVIFCKYIGSCLTENIIGTNIFIPIHLIYNAGHYFGFLIGLLLALVVGITNLQVKHQRKE